jgi:hypothetical protein
MQYYSSRATSLSQYSQTTMLFMVRRAFNIIMTLDVILVTIVRHD